MSHISSPPIVSKVGVELVVSPKRLLIIPTISPVKVTPNELSIVRIKSFIIFHVVVSELFITLIVEYIKPVSHSVILVTKAHSLICSPNFLWVPVFDCQEANIRHLDCVRSMASPTSIRRPNFYVAWPESKGQTTVLLHPKNLAIWVSMSTCVPNWVWTIWMSAMSIQD